MSLVFRGEDGRRPNSGDETAGLESDSAGIDLEGLWFVVFVFLSAYLGFQ